MDRENIEDIIALTPMQEGMLFHYLDTSVKDRDMYFEQLLLEISGRIDIEFFERAWNMVVEANEMLRTVFRWEKMKAPVQMVLKEFSLKPVYYDFDFPGSENRNKTEFIEKMKILDKEKTFDLNEVPFRITLGKIEEEGYVMLISHHHILYDGWSTGIILKEFFRAYHDLWSGKQRLKPPVKTKFKEFVRWIYKQDIQKQERYWKENLEGFDTQTEMPVKIKRGKGKHKGMENFISGFTTGLREEIERFVEVHKVTLASLFYTCWGVLLRKYSNCEDIVFGSTVSGRPAKIKGIENMVGLFINTLPMRMTFFAGEKTDQLLKRIHEILMMREPYENVSLVKIREYSGLGHHRELFDTLMVIENYPLDKGLSREKGEPPLFVNSYSTVEIPHYDLTAVISWAEESHLRFIFRREAFGREVIERLTRHFVRVLEDIVRNPRKGVHHIELLSEAEKERILVEFNDTAVKYPADKTIHRLFEEQVERNPDHTALVGPGFRVNDQKADTPGGLGRNVSITYKELNEESNRLAYLLKEKNIQPDTIVAIMMERCVELIIGILGILKAGGAYLPIDPGYPAERQRYMLADSSAGILLKESEIRNPKDIPIVTNFEFRASDLNSSGLAYIMYTSGTTGRPKAVMVTHQAVVRLVKNTNFVEFKEGDSILQTGAPDFDASTFEIWGALLNGLKLYAAHKNIILSIEGLKTMIHFMGISTLWLTSPLFNRMVEADIEIFRGLENLLVGGDALSPAHINKLKRAFPRLKVINGYGPTENTTFSATHLITEEYRDSIPLGRPIANSTVYILDNYNQPVPLGCAGELCTGGDGVARGYLNNPELTNEKFDHERKGTGKKKTLKIYKTGDLARWLSNGNIEFLGRKDTQVKIRGFRVELGEIENHLRIYPGIKDAVVIDHKNKTGEKYLYAYIVPEGSSPLNTGELKPYLLQKLPDYMIPSDFIKLEQIPLTPNGKVDRNALPEPGIFEPGVGYTAPRDSVEKKLAAIWQQVLGVDSIGIHDDFFDRGGHSLKVLNLVNVLRREFKVKIDFQDIFQFPTVAELRQRIEKADPTKHTTIRVEEEREYYELSYSQKRLWLLYEFEPDSPAFNLSGHITLPEKVDEHAVERVLSALVARHESFRTYFKRVGGNPVQIIQPRTPVNLETFDLSHLDEDDFERVKKILFEVEGAYPFELEKPPLFRTKLVKCKEDEYDLVLTMHHIISDGWSIEILEREFFLLYESYKESREYRFEPQLIRYKDYVYWHNRLLADKEPMQTAKEFWESRLKGELPVLNLPWDFPKRKKNLENKGSAGYRTLIPAGLTQRLRVLAREGSASLFMVLLAGFNLLLSRLSGQDDILLAVPGAARQHEQLENVIGLFVNTLILRNKIDIDESFTALLQKIQNSMLQVLEHQSYPLELICSEFKIRYPEISVFFNMLTFGDTHKQYLKNHESYHIEQVPDAKFDMVCYLTEYKDGVEIDTHYFRKLFRPGTIEKTMRKYIKILEDVSCEPGEKVGSSSSAAKKIRINLN